MFRFLSLARSKLRLCSANHRPGYWSNLPCDWLSTAWAYWVSSGCAQPITGQVTSLRARDRKRRRIHIKTHWQYSSSKSLFTTREVWPTLSGGSCKPIEAMLRLHSTAEKTLQVGDAEQMKSIAGTMTSFKIKQSSYSTSAKHSDTSSQLLQNKKCKR